jgi:chemotaxis methyl-accepting protein methylase
MYKGPCFERRLASRLRIRGVASVAAYADLLDREPEERIKLLSAIAIGVTSFFRNPSAWVRLAELLRAKPTDRVEAWCAGCATGEEPYSLALLLAGIPQRPGAWSVLGTDVDERSLAVAREADYPGRVTIDIENAGFTAFGSRNDGRFRIDETIRRHTTFRREDLLAPIPRSQFDLVVCRNVLIYFGAEGQRRALINLGSALREGGLLLLGKAELASVDAGVPLELVDRRERIYRRSG